jgi:hypothetical protein
MKDTTRIGISVASSATVIALALAATSGDDDPKQDAHPSCSFVLSERGSFTVGDDSGRCDLLFPVGRRLRCELSPVSDVRYQWSFRVTPLGIVTRGLQRGAAIAYECKE